MINSVNSEIFQIRSVAGGSYLFYFIFVGLKKRQKSLFSDINLWYIIIYTVVLFNISLDETNMFAKQTGTFKIANMELHKAVEK